ncbi:MAG: twin-arginine translocase subunit TatC [Planctomycetota bacterium]|nr:twin-arginine translocase subunit TatC [Planctomycetota bacterium]
MAPTDDHRDLAHGVMSFGDHLEELRRRIVLCLVVPLPTAILLFLVAPEIRRLLTAPALAAMEANGLPARMQALGPAEVLTTDLKLSIIGALVVTAPWIVWQAWKFIEPGLYRQEKRFVRFLVPGSAILTVAGLSFLYWIMLPLMLQVLISFGIPGPENAFGIPDPGTRIEATTATGIPVLPVLEEAPADPAPGQAWIDPVARSIVVVVPVEADGSTYELLSTPLGRAGSIGQEFRLGEYIGFVLTLAIAITIAFQMPLVIVLLGWIGLADRRLLTRYRRYAHLICAVLGAILTPADIVSMVLLFIPLYLLYEFGILLLTLAPADRVAAGTVLPGLHGDDSRTSDGAGFPTDSGQTDPPERSARPDRDRELDLDGSDENEADPTDDDREPGAS